MCSTCVDALNRLWTKILPVVNAATCAQVHVQIFFCSTTCSMMVQLCGVPLPCSQLLSPYAGHDRRMLHDSMYTVARALRLVAIFLRGRVSCASAGRRSPVSSIVPSPLASWTTKLTDIRFLHSTASCWTRWRSLFVALRSAS